MKKCCLLLIFPLIVTSCWNSSSNELIEIDDIDYYFTDESFTTVKEVRSTLLNDSMVHRPVRIALHDSVLFSVDATSSDDFMVRIFSANDGAYHGPLFHRGNGPKEVLSVDNITFSNNLFWAYDVTSQKWIGNDFVDIFNKKENEEKEVIDFKSLSYMGLMIHNGYSMVLFQTIYLNIKSVLLFILLKVKLSILYLTPSIILKNLLLLLFWQISFQLI